MKRLAVALMLVIPALVGAQNILTLPMNIIAVVNNNFVAHSYTSGKGNDFSMVVGTDVVAAYGGTAYTHDNGMDNSGGTTGGYGNYITINHGTIDEHAWETLYGHLSTGTFAVANGQRVERGQLLAKSGNAGWSSGPHLHFEVRRDGVPVDPYDSGSYLWTTNSPSHAPQFDVGQFPPWGIAGLDAARVGQKFRDARDAKNRFLEAYRSAGFANVSMTPYDNDRKAEYEGRYVHWWTVPPPPGTQGPNTSVLVQDVKLRALRGNGANVFTREEALLIYNPQTNMAYIVKEGFWGLYMERNGPVTLGAPIGDEELLSNQSIEQHFQRGWCSWDSRTGTLEAYNNNNQRILAHTVNYITIAGTGGDDTVVLDAPAPAPEQVIPLANVRLVIQPAESGYRYQLARGQERMNFVLRLDHSGGNAPLAYQFYDGATLIASGANSFCEVNLAAGNHAIRARVEAGSGNTLRSSEASQAILVEAAPKSDWGVPFEAKISAITNDGTYVYVVGTYVSGPNAGKGFLRRVSRSNPAEGQSYAFGFTFNEILPRGSYLFAATSGGLMVSKDQGATWSALYSNGQAYDIAILPGDKWNDWPIMILVGSAGGNSVCRGFWHPSEPNTFSNVMGINGVGPYVLEGGRRGDREWVFVVGSGPNGVQTHVGPYHLAYTNFGGQLRDPYASRAWTIYTSGAQVFTALQRNAGDNVYYSDDYGGSGWQKVRGIPAGDDVVAFTWINSLSGITRKGALYHAPSDPVQWRVIAGFSEELKLDLAAGQLATCVKRVGQDAVIGTERGLRVIPASRVATLAAAKPANSGEEFASAGGPALFENYPNPFNTQTVIRFSLPEAQAVRLQIYSITGSLVAELARGTLPAGSHTVSWEGSRYGNGIYLCVLEAGNHRDIRKITLLK